MVRRTRARAGGGVMNVKTIMAVVGMAGIGMIIFAILGAAHQMNAPWWVYSLIVGCSAVFFANAVLNVKK
jgi:hypothetical protein